MITYQVPSIVLAVGDTTVNKKDLVLVLTEFTIYYVLLTEPANSLMLNCYTLVPLGKEV